MKPYPEYKESGIDWLGNIPSNWNVRKIKYGSRINSRTISEKTDPSYEIEYVDISSVDSEKGITQTEKYLFENAPSRARRIVKDGDIIVSTVRTYLKAIAPIINPPPNMIVSTGFAVITPIVELTRGFASYVFRSTYFIHTVVARSVGVSYPAINSSDISNIKIPVPSSSEQHAIATFLDRETSRIDTLIAKKQRQIELLQEKRSALISHLVTKGLDPDVRMKDSGVEWLGQVPDNWRVVRLKNVVNLINNKIDEVINGLRYVGLENIKSWEGKLTHYNESLIPEGQVNTFESGDVLFSKLRPYLAKVIVPNYKGMCTGELLVLRPHKISQYYLLYLLLSKEFIYLEDSSTYGAKMPRANWEFIGNINIPIPPKNEQIKISNYLREDMNMMDNLIDIINKSIDFLKEYRTALISAAVTGKIDVRDEIEVADSVEDVRIAAEPGRLYVEDKSETDNTYRTL
jgi:type I restriction enzyme, S subunit